MIVVILQFLCLSPDQVENSQSHSPRGGTKAYPITEPDAVMFLHMSFCLSVTVSPVFNSMMAYLADKEPYKMMK